MNFNNNVEQIIILAAGKSLQLDGINKALIRHPITGKTILDYAISAFAGKKITVVVGFRAIQIMQAYPQLSFIYNPDWALSNNAMSLALALDNQPTYVLSGDIFVEPKLVHRLDNLASDLILTSDREKRGLTAIHCVLSDMKQITETYQGPVKNMCHPESLGLFKISSPTILREWQRRCYAHGNLFAGQLLPCELGVIKSAELHDEFFFEINTPTDYIRLVEESRSV